MSNYLSEILLNLSCLSDVDLARVLVEAKRIMYPMAVIEGGELKCAHCWLRSEPLLVEDEVTITHQIEHISERSCLAEGTERPASARDYGRLLLQCSQCQQLHRLPDHFRVEWTMTPQPTDTEILDQLAMLIPCELHYARESECAGDLVEIEPNNGRPVAGKTLRAAIAIAGGRRAGQA